ncbi:hypothetical protein NA644_22610, partial [Pseudomonas stutzeri]|uniref:hypothetical protein n=1 Tax=Stutzerimonas stutzeri TaxID=316 RepID=UPI00210AF7D4
PRRLYRNTSSLILLPGLWPGFFQYVSGMSKPRRRPVVTGIWLNRLFENDACLASRSIVIVYVKVIQRPEP